MASPYKWKQHGGSGQWVSEIFPETAKVVDDLCFIKSLHGSNPAHGAALLKIHTGSENFVRPSMGSWITYGLGSENRDLPGFVTICPTLGHGGVNASVDSLLADRVMSWPRILEFRPLATTSWPSAALRGSNRPEVAR